MPNTKMGGAGSARAMLLSINIDDKSRCSIVKIPLLLYRRRGRTIAYGVAGDCRGWSGRRETGMSPEPDGKYRLSAK